MNYYEILELKRDASQAEIRKRYKALIKKYHPDLYEGDKKFAEEKTVQINMAYDVLSVPELKEEYDIELELEEQKYNNNNPINNYYQDTTTVNDDYNYESDEEEKYRRMYERYNRYKNDYFFHKKYSNNGEKGSGRSYSDRMDDEFDKHIRNAEGFFTQKINVLQVKQKIIIILIAVLIIMVFVLISLQRIIQLSNNSVANRYYRPSYGQREYDVKSDNKSDKDRIIEHFITGLYKSYFDSNDTENTTQDNTVNNEGYEPDEPLNENSNSVQSSQGNLVDKYKDSKFDIGDYQINTDVLKGLSNDVMGAINYYYEAIEDLIEYTDLRKYSEDEIKALIYEYLQNNKFNWYYEEHKLDRPSN